MADEENKTETQGKRETAKHGTASKIDFAALSIPEIDAIIEAAQEAREGKKSAEIARLKAEFEGQLNQLNLSLGDIFPQPAHSTGKQAKGKASKADSLEPTEKGTTYQNPTNPADRWTAGVKKGRAPAWVTELREKGELHKHKAAS